jgi:chemotaxis methyl-accepting protein methylase
MARDETQTILQSAFSRFLGAYLFQTGRIWNHLPPSFRLFSAGRAYGRHLHALVRLHADRRQYFATFFLRNRAELELMRRLIDQKPPRSSVDISVLACSKGAEVYSILWTIRSARPDLRLRMQAVDVSATILTFAEKGMYSLSSGLDVSGAASHEGVTGQGDVICNTAMDQNAPIFERMTNKELEAMFEMEGNIARIRSWIKEGVNWVRGDACDPELVGVLGPQDIVVANRFLCHMEPAAADRCLRNIARLVKPGGYLFVSGIDLNVRAKVAKAMGWKPVTDLIRDIHEGDPSLRRGWPLEYWGLEPFCDDRSDWRIRYASVFQIGEPPLPQRAA